MSETSIKLIFSNYVDLQSRLLLLPLDQEECLGAVISTYTPSLEEEEEELCAKDILNSDDNDENSDSDASATNDEDGVIANDASTTNDEDGGITNDASATNDDEDGGIANDASTINDDEDGGIANDTSATNDKDGGIADDAEEDKEVKLIGSTSLADNLDDEESSECEEKKVDDETDIVSMNGWVLTGMEGKDPPQDWEACEFSCILATLREMPTPIILMFRPGISLPDDDGSVSSDPSMSASGNSFLSRWSSRVRVTTSLVAAEAAKRTAALAETAVEAAAKAQAAQSNKKTERDTDVSGEPVPSLYLHTEDSSLTNSSIVSVRMDSEAPPKEYTYQWYAPNALLNATYPTFQPSAFFIGRSLKCHVKPHNLYLSSDIVSAEMGLFVAARRSLGAGNANFGNLEGMGNAIGRIFRIRVGVGVRGGNPCSSLEVFQVRQEVAEPIHDLEMESIYQATARLPDPTDQKMFEVIFSPPIPELLKALCTNGVLTLKAPNRITRESFLLTLGIANYKGRPGDLTPTTSLFEEVKIIPDKDRDDFSLQNKPSFDSNQEDIILFKNKLTSRDDTIASLENRLKKLEHVIHNLEREVQLSNITADKHKDDYADCFKELRLAQQRIQTHEDLIQRMKNDNIQQIASLQDQLNLSHEKVNSFQKSIITLEIHNEELTSSLQGSKQQIDQVPQLELQLQDYRKIMDRDKNLNSELIECQNQNHALSTECSSLQSEQEQLKSKFQAISSQQSTFQSEISESQTLNDALTKQLQQSMAKSNKLQMERNNYKQKADSLSKEISRLCKNGHEQQMDKMNEDLASAKEEAIILKNSKKELRNELEQERREKELLEIMKTKDNDTRRIWGERVELERVVLELTEILAAKEMQIGTMKEVHRHMEQESRQRDNPRKGMAREI